MRRALAALLAGALAATLAPSAAADGPCIPAGGGVLVTWGAPRAADPSPVAQARDLLARAEVLDQAAAAEDADAKRVDLRLASLRTAEKAARDPASAERLAAEIAVTEAEAAERRRAAEADRRAARELRARAVMTVREEPCDPPYRFTPDGRKIYRLECLR